MSDRSGDGGSDEEALRWEGDEQPGRPDDEFERPSAAKAAPQSAARRAATAAFVAVYLAIVAGWLLSVQYSASGSSSLFVDVSWQFGEFMAMAAGVLVFGAVHSLTRDRPTWVAVSWWLVGVLLLLPWPILLLLLTGDRG